MADQVTDLDHPFKDVFEALDTKEQRKAMKSAMRREGNRLKKAALQNIAASGLGKGTRQPIGKGLRVRVYPDRYGAGFMLTTKPRGKKGVHRNRQGKLKPVLMWAEDGTKARKTKTKTRVFIRLKKGHNTGRMPAYGFMKKTEEEEDNKVENDLFADFQNNLDRQLKKKRLL